MRNGGYYRRDASNFNNIQSEVIVEMTYEYVLICILAAIIEIERFHSRGESTGQSLE